MFGKFFASAFTGSMMASGADVFALWGYVIANAAGSRVELNPKLIAVLIGTTPEKIEESIKFLCAPDPNSRSKNDDGCRLIREGEYQYFVPNHEKYRSIRDEEGRREYNRLKQQEHRSKLKGGVKRPVNDSQSLLPKSTMSAHTEAEAEAEAEGKPIGNSLPRCPVDKIVEIYHQTLPELPKVMALTEKRKSAIKQRWSQLKPESEADGLDGFKDYFTLVRSSDFLMGKKQATNGHKVFFATLEWLVNESNFIKVAERNYHERV